VIARSQHAWIESEVALLRALSRGRVMPFGEIAVRLGMSQSGASRLVKRLVRQGMLTSKVDPRNERAKIIRATEKGKAAGSLLRSPRASRKMRGHRNDTTVGDLPVAGVEQAAGAGLRDDPD